MEFEGDAVVDFLGRIPAVTVEMPDAYARGTILKLNVEVRVKSVRLEENKDGDLVRHHIFAVEDLAIDKVITPADLQKALTSGNASGNAQVLESSEGPVEIESFSTTGFANPTVVINSHTGEVIDAAVAV